MSNTQLPAHLLALFNANPEAASIGSSIEAYATAKIRYVGSKFKLVKATGEEIPVPTSHLDVIVVGINEHKSHTVYDTAYDPKAEAEAPVWSSDDGTPVPAEHENKVVTDYRRWAVVVADNPDGGVFELRLSPGSITNGDRYVTALKNNGAPVAGLITRLTFDPAFDYPKLVFTPAAYINEAQAKAVGTVLQSGKSQINIAIGRTRNKPALAAPTPQAALAAPALSPQVQGAVQGEPSGQTMFSEGAKRKRRTKEEMAAAAAPAISPALVVNQPSAAAATVTNPTPTDSNLDNLLANIMGR